LNIAKGLNPKTFSKELLQHSEIQAFSQQSAVSSQQSMAHLHLASVL
jgi:hypothetical protein